jgi:hypothetical protein
MKSVESEYIEDRKEVLSALKKRKVIGMSRVELLKIPRLIFWVNRKKIEARIRNCFTSVKVPEMDW